MSLIGSKVLGILISGILLVLSASSPVTSAEKTIVPKFKNIDEAIGWLKAKGECRKITKARHQECNIRIELPEDKRGKSVWDVWAFINLFEFEYGRSFSVKIVKSRYFSLSAGDAKNRVRSGKMSTYYFDEKGQVASANVGFALENFKGELLLSEDFPVPEGRQFSHGEGGDDLAILRHDLGFGWKFK